MNAPYLFTSERLGFRNWIASDLPKMVSISGNPKVMEFFPATATEEQTVAFVGRMQALFQETGYCYFAVERLEDSAFMGFIGLNDITYEANFSPGTDIGWRLDPEFWGQGYATEGAKRCLQFAKENTQLKRVVATAPILNQKSIAVMEKIGMQFKENFIHPRLIGNERLQNCACYEIKF